MLKDMVTQHKAEGEAQLAALDAETATMQGLLEETQNNIVDLVKAWRNGNAQQRQELAFSLYPEGLVYSRELRYFEPRNVFLMQAMREMIDGVLAGEHWSGRRDLNPRLRPWQGRTLPLSYSRSASLILQYPPSDHQSWPVGRERLRPQRIPVRVRERS